MSKVQAVIFDKNKFTTKKAREWVDKHNFSRAKRVHITKNNLRYRIREPDTEKRYRTKQIANGIKFILEFDK